MMSFANKSSCDGFVCLDTLCICMISSLHAGVRCVNSESLRVCKCDSQGTQSVQTLQLVHKPISKHKTSPVQVQSFVNCSSVDSNYLCITASMDCRKTVSDSKTWKWRRDCHLFKSESLPHQHTWILMGSAGMKELAVQWKKRRKAGKEGCRENRIGKEEYWSLPQRCIDLYLHISDQRTLQQYQ